MLNYTDYEKIVLLLRTTAFVFLKYYNLLLLLIRKRHETILYLLFSTDFPDTSDFRVVSLSGLIKIFLYNLQAFAIKQL